MSDRSTSGSSSAGTSAVQSGNGHGQTNHAAQPDDGTVLAQLTIVLGQAAAVVQPSAVGPASGSGSTSTAATGATSAGGSPSVTTATTTGPSSSAATTAIDTTAAVNAADAAASDAATAALTDGAVPMPDGAGQTTTGGSPSAEQAGPQTPGTAGSTSAGEAGSETPGTTAGAAQPPTAPGGDASAGVPAALTPQGSPASILSTANSGTGGAPTTGSLSAPVAAANPSPVAPTAPQTSSPAAAGTQAPSVGGETPTPLPAPGTEQTTETGTAVSSSAAQGTIAAAQSQVMIAGRPTGPAAAATPQASQINQATVQAQLEVPTSAQNGGSAAGQGDTRGQGSAGQDGAAQEQTASAGDQPAGMAEPGFTAALRDMPQMSGVSGLVRQNVSLQDLVETVKATFTTASQSGLSSARISLSPASLGNIEISLTQTSQGLVAHVAADHPDAVQTLQQNAADLRRSLESGGMSLLQLDIGASGEQRSGYGNDPSARGGAGEQALQRVDGLGDEDEDATASIMTIALTGGSLVDVLA